MCAAFDGSHPLIFTALALSKSRCPDWVVLPRFEFNDQWAATGLVSNLQTTCGEHPSYVQGGSSLASEPGSDPAGRPCVASKSLQAPEERRMRLWARTCKEEEWQFSLSPTQWIRA